MSSPIIQLPALLPQRLFATPLVNDKGMVQADGVWGRIFQLLPWLSKIPRLQKAPHSLRITTSATSFPDGSKFYETDRHLWYIAVLGKWLYLAGIYSVEQESLPVDLTADDVGVLVFVSDYAHLLQWTGSEWTWASGEQGSGFLLDFLSAPDPVTGWMLCDGSTDVPQLLADGTLTFAGPLPSTAGRYFRQ